MKKVSIISGIYFPPEDLFRRFLDSCLNTTLDGVEFILLLDDPKDTSSKEILNEYQNKISKNKNEFIVVENEENLGINETSKKGYQLSTGEYVSFFDSDDFFDDDYIEVLYTYAKSINAPILEGRELQHYYENVSPFAIPRVYMPISIQNNKFEMSGIAGDSWDFLYSRKFIDDNISILDTIQVWFNVPSKTPCPTLPLSYGSFYHYNIRNSSTSRIKQCKSTVDKIEVSTNSEIYDFYGERINDTVLYFKNNFSGYSVDQIENLLLEHFRLDKLENDPSYFNYERLKRL